MGLALFAAMPVFAQQKATINVHPEQGKEIISKHIVGRGGVLPMNIIGWMVSVRKRIVPGWSIITGEVQ